MKKWKMKDKKWSKWNEKEMKTCIKYLKKIEKYEKRYNNMTDVNSRYQQNISRNVSYPIKSNLIQSNSIQSSSISSHPIQHNWVLSMITYNIDDDDEEVDSYLSGLTTWHVTSTCSTDMIGSSLVNTTAQYKDRNAQYYESNN